CSFHPVQSLISVGDISSLVWTNDATVLVDPDCRRDVHHVVEAGNEMFCVDQYGVLGFGGCDELSGVPDSARVLRDRDDLEIASLQFSVELLPSRQIEGASSPRC